jgi:hypothetical protein
MIDINKIFYISDSNRKRKAEMLYNFFVKDKTAIEGYCRLYASKIFSAKTLEKMFFNHKDIVRKTLINLCTAYINGVDRSIRNIATNELIETDVYDNYYLIETKVYQLAKLMSCVDVRVRYNPETDKIDFRIWTPNFYSVIEKQNNPLEREAVIYDVALNKNYNLVNAKEIWTNDECYYLINGQKESLFEDGSFKNPYGIIPSVTLRFGDELDNYFGGVGLLDLVELNIWQNIDEANLRLISYYQGLGILFGINIGKSDEIKISPSSIVAVEDATQSGNRIPPSLESINPNAPLIDLQENISKDRETTMMSYGLSSIVSSMENKTQSGIAKAIEGLEAEINNKSDENVLIDFEKRLFEVIKIINNAHRKNKIPDTSKLDVWFLEQKNKLSLQEELAEWQFKFDNKLTTKYDYIKANNPRMSDEQILAEIERIEKTNFES